jgi:ATP citrate (pro-S)-lyase
VDGCIAVSFVDMMQSCGAFSNMEADELVKHGCVNGVFVLGRSMGTVVISTRND